MMKSAMSAVAILVFLVLSSCKQAGYQNEGTQSNPVVITVGIPHTGTIAGEGFSFYQFAVVTGGNYTIALTNTQTDLSWHLFDAVYTIPPIWDQDDIDWAAGDEIWTLGLAAATYKLLVVEYLDIDSTFTLSVTGPF